MESAKSRYTPSPPGPDAHAGVADLLGGARRDVARRQVAVGRVLALQVVVALGLGNLVGRPLVARLLGHPDAAVVAQRLGHERQLRLVLAGARDARGVDLGVARVGEERALAVGPPGGGDVRALGVGGQVVEVAVPAGGQHHRVAEVRLDLPGDQVAGHDAAGAAVDDHQVEHLGAREHRDLAELDLAHERLVGADEELLAGLPAGVEGAGDQRAAEGAVGERAAVLAGEGDALGGGLVDDVVGHLGEPVDVGLAGAEVAALDGVVEEPPDGVTVVLVALGGVDAALRRDGVGAARRVLEAEVLDVVAQLAEGRRRGGAGQAGAHHDDRVLPLVGGVDELHVVLPLRPLLGERSGGNPGVEGRHPCHL